MGTEASTSRPGSLGMAILDQLADLDARGLSTETARELLRLRFDDSHHERVNFLSTKAQEGTLTPAERDEIDEYIRVGNRLAILHSKARQALRNAGVAP